jgi:hypothetical protein
MDLIYKVGMNLLFSSSSSSFQLSEHHLNLVNMLSQHSLATVVALLACTAVSALEAPNPPLITSVVPYFDISYTAVDAGIFTIGAGCSLDIVTALFPTTLTITSIGTSTTTYPCSTPTVWTSIWGTGTSTTATYTWTPTSSSCPCTASTTSTSSSTVPVTTTSTAPTSTSTTLTTVTKTTTTITTTSSASTTMTTTAVPTFSCDKYGYLIQSQALYQVDIQTGGSKLVKNPIVSGQDNINAIGYNVLDSFIYGYHIDTGIIRISSSGAAQAVAAIPSAAGNIGDVDTSGYYWLSSGGTDWWRIDLVPGSATYGKILANGTANNLGISIADWAYVPSKGQYLWSVGVNTTSSSTVLMRFDMSTHIFDIVTRYPTISATAWGAVFAENNGTLFASDNGSGHIWQFPLSGGTPFKLSNGPISSSNDGARCVLNILS